MAFRWPADVGPLIVAFGSFLPSSNYKKVDKVGPLCQNFLFPRMRKKRSEFVYFRCFKSLWHSAVLPTRGKDKIEQPHVDVEVTYNGLCNLCEGIMKNISEKLLLKLASG